MKLIDTILGLAIIVFRLYIIFDVLSWLFKTANNHNSIDITQIQWSICFMICDFYVSNIFKVEKE